MSDLVSMNSVQSHTDGLCGEIRRIDVLVGKRFPYGSGIEDDHHDWLSTREAAMDAIDRFSDSLAGHEITLCSVLFLNG
jgi:hypothetical protein